VIARLEDVHQSAVGEDARHRVEASREGLAQRHDVGADAVVLVGEERPGAAETGLDLVGDEQGIVPFGELAELREIPRRRHDDTGLALDRFDEDGDRALVHRRPDGVGIPEGQQAIAAGERTEPLTVLGARGEADDRGRAAVEVVVEDQDLALGRRHALDGLPPLPGQLDGSLDRLGAAVHRQEALEAGERADLLAELAELVVAEGARAEGQPLRLLGQALHQTGVAVPLIHRRVGGEKIEVAIALDVPDPDALAACDDDLERVIVVGAVTILERDQILGGEGGGCCEQIGHRELREGAMRGNPTGFG